jgi:hypothetical protein
MSTFRIVLTALLLSAAGVVATLGEESGFHQGDWPFTPLRRPAVPETRRTDWAINPVDSFVLVELEKRGLTPNMAADRETLLRRVTFDLTGLPPTIEEIDAFLADDSPQAYERVVERLLNSPRFGERWARHWLDVVRYADTAGFKSDFVRPDAYRYRDYVIDAFNNDLPFNRFVAQQIAGDELEPENPQALIATGMLRLYAAESTASDFVKQRQDVLDDITDTTSLTFLGLTMGCAQCHDHKFDPILQTDFYRLQACFAGMVPQDEKPAVDPETEATYRQRLAEWEKATAELREQVAAFKAKIEARVVDEVTLAYDGETRQAWLTPREKRTTKQRQLVGFSSYFMQKTMRRRLSRLEGEEGKQYQQLEAKLRAFDAMKPAPLPTAMTVREGNGPAPTYVLATGDYRKPEEEVSPGYPEFLGEGASPPDSPTAAPRRSALARWLTLPDHPLTTRVMVNRLWQHHFGRGIVASANDFGAMGDSASHPKLLDYLASELVDKHWSLKAIHRLLVTSATYRQSSLVDAASEEHAKALKADPENKYFWRANRVRLGAEPLRDSLLALTGRLNDTLHGPSAFPLLSEAVRENSAYAWEPDPSESQHYRRSIYTVQKRNLRLPILAAYDQPDMYLSCAVRSNTLTPTQSLTLLNGDDAMQSARQWSGRLLRESHGDDEQLVRRAWREAYGRTATNDEVTLARKFLARQAKSIYDHETDVPTRSLPDPAPSCLEPNYAAAYVDFCHALLNSSEFLFID